LPARLSSFFNSDDPRHFAASRVSTGMRLRLFIYATASLALLLCYAPFHFATSLLQSSLRRFSVPQRP